ncbi:ABC transporter substrate binding protein [Clostridium chromiireducens]|uniref:Phytochrome-like protein cph2 n=1 Tax=Clostridium chromiireducens TaxID=225345 RepID=A0A1V4IC34_9CLOT|nr:ABC transporter substrate binding protein [Clostridium chromiireducens]OPJ57568.1 phytochrome-like protein cph2 [Clostridium chromiireducens]
MKNTLKIKRRLAIVLFLTCILINFESISVKSNELNKNILILNSYSSGYDWTDGQNQGIVDTLDSKDNIIKYVEYMDWKRYNSKESLNNFYEYCKNKYSNKKIDLIITTDDAALNFAIKYRKDLFSDAPLVFGGVNKDSADSILKDISNVTGVYESIDPEGTIEDALKIKPETKNIYVIHDNTETGIAYYNLIEKFVYSLNKNLTLYDLGNYSFVEICNITSSLNNDSIILLDAYSSEYNGFSLPLKKISHIISSNSSVPVFTTSEALVGEGCIGGSTLSAKVHGKDIGDLALRALDAEDINTNSYGDKKSLRSIYDYNVLKKYNLTSAILPQNSIVINKPFSFYETYKVQIYIVLLIFIILIILIIYLIINIRKRIEVEKKLIENNEEINALYEELLASEESLQMNYGELNRRQNDLLLSEEKYRLVAESTNDIIWEEDVKDNTRKFSDKLFEILGYTGNELSTYFDWYNIIHPMDRNIVEKAREQYPNRSVEENNIEYRVRCKNGQYKWITSNSNPQHDENGKIIKIFGAYKDISKLKENQLEINDLAFYDSITKLPNRVSLYDTVPKIINSAINFTMFFVDLDNFKIINDSFGHSAGDKLLVLVTQRLNSMTKNEFTAFRLGGDEFIIIYKGLNDKKNIEDIADKILYKISQPYKIDDNYFYISASIGITSYPENGNDLSELLKNADTAMYKSKESGKNKYTFFNAAMGEDTLKKINLHNNLQNAIKNNEFILYYQPITDVISGKIVGMEALIRWFNPKEGLISPDKFIAAAEESGQIIEIGTWVIKNACHFAKELLNKGHRDFYISVNVSAVQLIQKNFKDVLFSIINETGILPENLMLEITESVFMESFHDMSTLFSDIRERGVKIALDDFGCGYSSLTYLKNLPMDSIKIDKSFIDDILSTNEKNCIVGLIITLMKQLEFKVIAEGIEQKEQLEYIKKYKCDYFQGYLISKPVTKDQILELLDV